MKIFTVLTAAIIALTSVTEGIVQQYEITDSEYINDYDEPIEDYIYCAVEAPNVSIEEIVPLTEVVFVGQNCAEIFISILEESGFVPIYSGTTEEWFYLSAVEEIDTSNAFISDEAKAYLSENNIEYTDSVSIEGTLGEFDFTDTSGWVFTVNDELPSVGMCDYIPKPGDKIELIFTLNYGEDLLL